MGDGVCMCVYCMGGVCMCVYYIGDGVCVHVRG